MLQHNATYIHKDNILVDGVIQGLELKDQTIKSQHNFDALLSCQYRNVLFNNALPVFAYIIELINFPLVKDVHPLRDLLLGEINSFISRLYQENISKQIVEDAKYVLCAMLDEIILNQQQGSDANYAASWSQHNLVTTFFPDAWGGEKFFSVLERNLRAPKSNLDLLELMLFCLNLGFEGKYRDMPRGSEQLNILRQRLFAFITSHRQQVAVGNNTLPNKKSSILQKLREVCRFNAMSMMTVILLLTIFAVFNVKVSHLTRPLLNSLHVQV